MKITRSFRGRLALRFGIITMLLTVTGSGLTYVALHYVLYDRLDALLRRLAEIEASALSVAAEAPGEATVVGGTVVYARDGSVARAPVIAELDDGQRIVAKAEPALLASLAGKSLVGSRVSVAGSPPVYKQ